jgi:hypothetical protein
MLDIDYRHRNLTQNEKAVLNTLYTFKPWAKSALYAFAMLTEDFLFPAGTTLKIVKLNKFGELCVTDDLDTDVYKFSVYYDDAVVNNIRWEP